MRAHAQLIAMYLDYMNNYVTVAKWAEHNGLTRKQAMPIISIGSDLHENGAHQDDQ